LVVSIVDKSGDKTGDKTGDKITSIGFISTTDDLSINWATV
jgi:hypothetical protein